MANAEGVAGYTGKTIRPVKCLLCQEPMFYNGEPGHVPEFKIYVEDSEGIEESRLLGQHYVHQTCWKKWLKLVRINLHGKEAKVKKNEFRKIEL